ncbi:unnamed protein product [Moneuplotes crassus]|uniref:RING-type domain-containing protein n=1 Tax=Euplotes crassus TaxID=5936 RepID=A0AAD1UQ26_EUPCR|nr:unnamed protein product [Moneuplotes crassus]
MDRSRFSSALGRPSGDDNQRVINDRRELEDDPHFRDPSINIFRNETSFTHSPILPRNDRRRPRDYERIYNLTTRFPRLEMRNLLFRDFNYPNGRNDSLVSGLSREIQEEAKEIPDEAVGEDKKGPDLGILTCTICYSKEFKGIMICRFCSSTACKLCWDKIMTNEKKCPFCRKMIYHSDLIKSKLADELKEIQEKEAEAHDKTCPEHGTDGSIYCKDCSHFLCVQCLTAGIHTGHSLADIEKDQALKNDLIKMQHLRSKIESSCSSLKEAIQDHSEYWNVESYQLDQMAQHYKDTIITKIDRYFEKAKEKLINEKLKLQKATNDLSNIQQVQEEVFTQHYQKLGFDNLHQKVNDSLTTSNAANIIGSQDTQTLTAPTQDDMKDHYELTSFKKEGENCSSEIKKNLELCFKDVFK